MDLHRPALVIGPWMQYGHKRVRLSGHARHLCAWTALQAVQQGRAYAIWHHYYNSPFNVVAVQVMAKWLYPELFADLDPQATLKALYARHQPIPLQGVYWTGL